MSETRFFRIVATLSKPAEERNDLDIVSMLPWFRKKTAEVFRDLKTDILVDIIKNCRFVTLPSDGAVIKQGDHGDCMYIVLSGQVSVYIQYAKDKDKTDTEEQDEFMTEETVDKGVERSLSQTTKKSFVKIAKKVQSKTEEEKEQLKKEEMRSEKMKQLYGTYVCSLGPGTTFGEVALLTDDCVRTASIVCDTTSDLLIIERQLYERSVRKILAKEFEDREKFIEGSSLFSKWPSKFRKQLAMAMTRIELPFERVLIKQGDPVTAIYFIVRGELKITMDPDKHVTQYRNIWSPPGTEDAQINEGKPDKGKRRSRRPHSHHTPLGVSSEYVDICFQSNMEVLGDMEVFLGLTTFSCTAVSTQPTDVVVIDLKHFDRLVTKRNPASVEQMQTVLASRISERFTKHIQRRVPFTTYLLEKCLELVNPTPDEMTLALAEINQKVHYSDISGSIVPPRGCLADMFGSGTIFYRIKKRHQQKMIEEMNLEKYGIAHEDNDAQHSQRIRSKSPKSRSPVPKEDKAKKSRRVPTASGPSDAFILDAKQFNDILQQMEQMKTSTTRPTHQELEAAVGTWLSKGGNLKQRDGIVNLQATLPLGKGGINLCVKQKKKMIIRKPSEDLDDEEEEDDEFASIRPKARKRPANKSAAQEISHDEALIQLRNKVLEQSSIHRR